jgi:hypothetical protein
MALIEGSTDVKTWKGSYSFAVDGGGTGTYVLRSNDGPIPVNSYILSGVLDVSAGFTTSASGQGALSVEGANDLVSATIVSGAPYSTTGNKSLVPVGTGATAIQTTAALSPAFAISVGAITAGAFDLILTYR